MMMIIIIIIIIFIIIMSLLNMDNIYDIKSSILIWYILGRLCVIYCKMSSSVVDAVLQQSDVRNSPLQLVGRRPGRCHPLQTTRAYQKKTGSGSRIMMSMAFLKPLSYIKAAMVELNKERSSKTRCCLFLHQCLHHLRGPYHMSLSSFTHHYFYGALLVF